MFVYTKARSRIPPLLLAGKGPRSKGRYENMDATTGHIERQMCSCVTTSLTKKPLLSSEGLGQPLVEALLSIKTRRERELMALDSIQLITLLASTSAPPASNICLNLAHSGHFELLFWYSNSQAYPISPKQFTRPCESSSRYSSVSWCVYPGCPVVRRRPKIRDRL